MKNYGRKINFWFMMISASFATILFTSCDTVPLPSSDPTPPTIRWKIEHPTGGSVFEVQGDYEIFANYGEKLRVTCFAEDPEGIKMASLIRSDYWECLLREPYLTQKHGPSLGVERTQGPFPVTPNGVMTSTFLIEDIVLRGYSCPDGWTYANGRLWLYAKGENYFGGTTQATLTIRMY